MAPRWRERKTLKHEEKMTMADINPPISLITLSVSGTNTKGQSSCWQNVIQIESRMVVARDCGERRGMKKS